MSNARIQASDRRPVEEIDAIMVKYSAWASSRTAKAPPPDGIREVTYSSALHASNSRRKVRTDLVLPAQEPTSIPKPARPQPRTPKPPPSRRKSSPADAESGPQEDSALAPAKAAHSLQRPSNRVVSLSVRLAAEECALVKSRAADARLSVSAYLRQCVLDVDAMRIFVEKISAELRANADVNAFSRPVVPPTLLPAHTPAARRTAAGFLARGLDAFYRLFSS
jgi:hypothetical protein